MPSVTRSSLPDAFFGTRADGSIVALRAYVEPITEFLAAAAYIQWNFDGELDDGFTYLGGWSINSSDSQAVEDIMRSGSLWDASWENLKSGNIDYTSPRDNSVWTGANGVSRRFQDWVIVNTTHDCEAATDVQWMTALMAGLQTELNARLDATPKPPKPTAPPPLWQAYPPLAVGQIYNALTLDLAQCARMTLSPDPANPNRMVIGKIPVP